MAGPDLVPYAYRRRPMRRIDSVMALKLLWEQAYPNHRYVFEPQSAHYLTHGDLWDYFYKQVNRQGTGTFIPLTLKWAPGAGCGNVPGNCSKWRASSIRWCPTAISGCFVATFC